MLVLHLGQIILMLCVGLCVLQLCIFLKTYIIGSGTISIAHKLLCDPQSLPTAAQRIVKALKMQPNYGQEP
jgi:hypothetical protein